MRVSRLGLSDRDIVSGRPADGGDVFIVCSGAAGDGVLALRVLETLYYQSQTIQQFRWFYCTDCNTGGMCSIVCIVASIRSALLSLTDTTTQFPSFCCTNCTVFRLVGYRSIHTGTTGQMYRSVRRTFLGMTQ